jgi:hypothetical protein
VAARQVNAALMLHDHGASEAEAHAYLGRWALLTPVWADHVIRFVTEPTQRTYIVNYSAGRELCGAYVGDDPSHFRRLLTEQVRVGELLDSYGFRTDETPSGDGTRGTTRRE